MCIKGDVTRTYVLVVVFLHIRNKLLQMYYQYGGRIYYGGLPEKYGNGVVYFAGVPEQYGTGLGNILGSMFRRVVPFLFPAVKNIASTYIQSAAKNLGEGKSLGESLKDSLKDAGKQTLSEAGGIASNLMKGSGRRKKSRKHTKKATSQKGGTLRKSSGKIKHRAKKQRGGGGGGSRRKNVYKRGSGVGGVGSESTLSAFLNKRRKKLH